MKRYVYIISIILFLLILSIMLINHSVIVDKNEKVLELKKYVKNIESISPRDLSFSDLNFLKEVLKNKDIILLGEQTHSDGATFLAKSRLIKYIHEELGFDVLIYESGLYDTNNLWNELKASSNRNIRAFSNALYNFWWNNDENEELLNYILNKIDSKNEIEIAGLDVQFSGQIKENKRDSLLTSYLNTQPYINSKLFPSFYSIKKKYSSFTNTWIANRLPETRKDSILMDIHSIIQLLEGNKIQKEKDSLYLRFFKNLDVLYTYSWKYKLGSDIRFHMRDSAMAENFIWLKENKFKNRKVIIWAANLHTSYNNYSYNPVPARFTSMGEYIKKKYGEKCYSINFTSFSNDRNLNCSDEVYNNKTIEFLLHQLDKPYLYLDFNTIEATSYLHQKIIMNCNQSLSFNASWYEITDGIFYIDNMTNLHKLKD